jgi:hypothetical protein
MGKILPLFALLFFYTRLSAQYNVSASEFDLSFKEEVIPDKDLTDLRFCEDVKSKKIKSIKINSFRKRKFDSIYYTNRSEFNYIFKQPDAIHHMNYSFTRIFKYNSSGYCTFYGIYPVTKLFTKQDSVHYNENYRIEFIAKGDTQIVTEILHGKIVTKRAYVKNKLMYFINNRDCIKMGNALNDSILIDEKQVLYSYFYENNKLNKVFRNGIVYKQFEYPTPSIIKVKCTYVWGYTEIVEVESLTKLSNGKIVAIDYYYKDRPKEKISWIVNYDEKGNCLNIRRIDKFVIPSDDIIIKFKNIYKENKLNVSEPKPYYLNYGESIKNTFYENGLLKSKESELGIDEYEYTFFD